MAPDPAPLALLYTMMPLWIVALVAGALVPWALLRDARLAPVDLPGQHRSHATPTPRGGGLGIAVALLGSLFGIWLAATRPGAAHEALWLAAALVLVAGIGALDDHRNLPAWPRFIVHLIAAVCVSVALGVTHSPPWFVVLFVLTITWSINLHNFMDGVNGLLALQALFVAAVIAGLALMNAAAPLATLAGATALACIGFLPFNFPRARIFLGDVGSGVLGLIVAVLVWRAVARDLLPLAGALALVSAFVVDATLTLATRMLRGRRWYTRHREHLYQWLARSGASHLRVALLYVGWNLWVALPTALATRVLSPLAQWLLAIAVYAIATLVWFAGKHAVRRARQAARHARRDRIVHEQSGT
jgi:UDP-N-acetylmuramyl pentapeptide phosphotransferase/UDP-N-acetylglucosamine-1-phosphate transferase